MTHYRASITAAVLFGGLAIAVSSATAQKRYDLGASDTEIKIGNIMPYSGPASSYGVIGETEAAYFNKINAEGGINGRRINFISYDDAYSPPKTVEQARKLVESDGVLLIFNSLGTPTNTAIHKYMNDKKVPQLFVATGATKWDDPKHFPWTMGWIPNYQSEGRVFAQYLLREHPSEKIGILFQNDDSGKDYVKGIKDGLRGRMSIVAELSYEPLDPTIDSQIVALKGSGADIFFDDAIPKFAAQAIKKVAEIGWKPLHLLVSVSNSVGSTLRPAGLEISEGIISTAFAKDPTDPQWQADPAYKAWVAFMDKYYPNGDQTTTFTVVGYLFARTLVEVLRQCRDDLTRENVMRQAANLHNLQLEMLLPGITINTGPFDFAPVKQMQMQRFNSRTWELFGSILNGALAGA
jgi:branched-chain amino acid transport system substrate-binding protein